MKLTPEMKRLMSPQDQVRYFALPPEPLPKAIEESEAWHQAQFAHWLKAKELLPPAVWHNTAKRTTGTIGCPDFIVPAAGCVLWLEFKLPGNELSPEQKLFALRLREQGGEVTIVYHFEAAIELLAKYI